MSIILSDAEIDEFHRKFLACWCPDCNKAAQFIAAVKDVRQEKRLLAENSQLRQALKNFGVSDYGDSHVPVAAHDQAIATN